MEEINQNEKALKYIILCRHGERSDFAYHKNKTTQKELRKGDAQLTDRGCDQARQTGEMIKQLLAKWNVSKVKIYSSPLIRCLQTAMFIAQKCNVNQVETHDGFIDIVTKHYMPLSLNELELRLEHCVTQKRAFYFRDLEDIEIIDSQKYKDEMIEHGAESQSKCWKRSMDYINRMIENWNEISAVDQSPSEAIIVATHGEVIDAFSYFYTKEFGEVDY